VNLGGKGAGAVLIMFRVTGAELGKILKMENN
jgi:hypothetical protein